MDKWILQVMDGQNWEHVLMMVSNNLGKLDLKVVALGPAVVPIFAPGKLRGVLQDAIDKGLSLEICSVSMASAGLSEATLPRGALAKPGLVAISEARKNGFLYFVVA